MIIKFIFKYYAIIILILIINFSGNAQDFTKVHQLIVEGQSYIFDVDFQNALSKFQEAKSVAPNDLRGPFFESTVYFWKGLLTKNKTEYETFINLTDNLITKCEDIIDKNQNDLDANFYLGWSYTLRAFITYMVDQNLLKAASNIKDGNKYLSYVVEKNPNYYDAYLGLGVYNYMISLIPKKYQWLTSILGFSGDKDEGKKQLITCSEKGIYTNTEAKFYLTLLLWREENYPSAEDYANKLKSAYPNSPAIWMISGLLFSQQDKVYDAITAFEKAIEFNKGKESEFVYKSSYGALGTAYFKTNQFEKAIEYLKKYMGFVNKDDRVNFRLYNIGVSMEMLGRRSEAVEFYKQGKTDFAEDNDWEKYHLRKVNERLVTPLTYIDSMLIVADNNRSTGNVEQALKDYNTLNTLDQIISSDAEIQINHGFGQCYFKLKDYNKAIEYFKMNINIKPINEKWLVPEAYYQIGRCYLRLGNKSEATKYFDLADDIDYDYDFKDSMDRKIKNELSKF